MKVWKFSSGYVNIEMMGEYPEKLVNRCIESGIPVRNCVRSGKRLVCGVPMKDFPKLRPLSRGCGLRVRILSRHGMPRLFAALRRELPLVISALAAALTAAVLLSRLWIVRIEAGSADSEAVASLLSELGVCAGVPRSAVRTEEISAAINRLPGVSNAKVVLRGVTLTVTVSAAGADIPPFEDGSPSGIYADRDCVIRSIAATRGHACVKPGAAVKKGDLLITGDLSEEKEGLLVRADGVIVGEALFTAEATAERSKSILTESGRSETVTAVSVLGRELFFKAPYEEYSLTGLYALHLTGSPLPVVIVGYRCSELVPGTALDTEEGTGERARIMAQEKLKTLLPADARITTVGWECRVNPDGSVTAVITATALVSIGSRRNY